MPHPPRLDEQVCFPLYAASRLVIRLYQPLLEPLGLTYPQYLVMMLLWEDASLTVSQIGQKIYLDSSTLTPLLKKLEDKALIVRKRRPGDERVVEVSLTKTGKALGLEAIHIPERLFARIGFPPKEALQLRSSLKRLIARLEMT